MWRKIPLNYQLIISLLCVQIVSFSIAAEWLIQSNHTTRMVELNHRLFLHADFVEDVVEVREGRLGMNPNSEIRRELDLDKSAYFFIVGEDGRLIDENKGPPQGVIDLLKPQFETRTESKKIYQVRIGEDRWLLQNEPIQRIRDGVVHRAMGHVAILAEPILTSIDKFENMVISTAILLLLLASLATGFVVSYSTRNIRKFAHTLRTSNPMRSKATIDFKPLSYEESLLHDSYSDMIEAVEKSATSQRLFIAHASHELKTPIATALVVTELALSRERKNDEYRLAHAEVLDELKVLKRLSMTLLDFASLEEVNFNWRETGTCDLQQILELVRHRLQIQADARGIKIHINASEPAFAHGRGELWETVVNNLAENAIKYGKDSGILTLQLRKDTDRLSIEIQDDGVGISPENLARMGEVFFKVDAARAKIGSFGLGFAHAKRIVDRLGGRLEIRSKPGEGTTVLITVEPAA